MNDSMFKALQPNLKYLGEITSNQEPGESRAWGSWEIGICQKEAQDSAREDLLAKAKEAGATHLYLTGSKDLGGMVSSAVIEMARAYKLH